MKPRLLSMEENILERVPDRKAKPHGLNTARTFVDHGIADRSSSRFSDPHSPKQRGGGQDVHQTRDTFSFWTHSDPQASSLWVMKHVQRGDVTTVMDHRLERSCVCWGWVSQHLGTWRWWNLIVQIITDPTVKHEPAVLLHTSKMSLHLQAGQIYAALLCATKYAEWLCWQ